MPKFAPAILDDPPSPRRSAAWSVLIVAIGLMLSPLIYEGSLLIVANWRAIRGAPAFVRTPVLDAVGRAWTDSGDSLQSSLGAFFHDLPWRPEHVLAVSAGWAVGGSLLLRSRLRR